MDQLCSEKGRKRAAGLAPQSAPLQNRDNLFPKDRGLANLTDSYADIYWAKHTSERVQDTKNVKHTCKSPLHHLNTPVTTRHSTLTYLCTPATQSRISYTSQQQLHAPFKSCTPQQQLHIPGNGCTTPTPGTNTCSRHTALRQINTAQQQTPTHLAAYSPLELQNPAADTHRCSTHASQLFFGSCGLFLGVGFLTHSLKLCFL